MNAVHLIASQEIELDRAATTLHDCDSLLSNERWQVVNAKVMIADTRRLYEGEKKLTLIEKQKKRRRTWLAIGIAGAWVIREFVVQ